MNTLANLIMLVAVLFNSLPLQASSPVRDEKATSPVASSVEVTATPTSTAAIEPTLESTAPATPLGSTEIPTQTATLTATPTPAASLTPAPTQTAALTATQAVTPTPIVGTPGPENEAEIALQASPEFITPGGQATIHWAVGQRQLEGYELVFSLSPGVEIKNATVGVYDPEAQTYRLPAASQGVFQIEVNAEVELPVYIDAQLLPPGQPSVATGSLALFSKADVQQEGGVAEGLNGKVKVTFPEGVLPEAAEVFIHRPLREAMPPHSLSGHPFEITARGAASGVKLDQFTNAVEIELSYADLGLPLEQADSLNLYYYDTGLQDWVALPSFVDPATGTLHGFSTHFTVFDIGLNNWQASHPPTVDNFQVSQFTGAATFNYPISVPPGPGGLQPSVSLSYNSQVIDQAVLGTQASWVGLGWALDVGSIERDLHNTLKFDGDDSYSLSLNGVSSQIIQQPDGSLHLADENFMRVERQGALDSSGSSWQVWDKEGNLYTFTARLANWQMNSCAEGGGLTPHMYQWVLTEARNKFGQTIVYSYEDETEQLSYYDEKCFWHSTSSAPVATASYLKYITYAGGHYRVEFSRQDRYRDFSDPNWGVDGVYQSFERTRLASVAIEKLAESGSYETVQTYELAYLANTNMLAGVTEYGGVNMALPAYTFTYGDGKHLTQASNGYGGGVTFWYEDDPDSADPYKFRPWYYEGGGRKQYGWSGGYQCSDEKSSDNWDQRSGNSKSFPCNINNMQVAFRGVADLKGGIVWYGMGPVRPGGYYKLSLWADTNFPIRTNTLDIKLGVKVNPDSEGVGGTDLETVVVPHTTSLMPNEVSTIIQMPENAYLIWPYISADYYDTNWLNKAEFGPFTIQLLPTFYRVAKKTISDGNGHSYDFTYAYDGAAVNDLAHSASLCQGGSTCYDYVEKYSEFRGHAAVTETGPGPDPKVVTTEFYQDDILKGQVKSVTVSNASGAVLTRSLNEYTSTDLPVAPLYHTIYGEVSDGVAYNGVFHRWEHPTSTAQYTYNTDGSFIGVKTIDTYEPTYGNLIKQTESSGNDTSGWVLYRTTVIDYHADPSITPYLVGLPKAQRVWAGAEGTSTKLSETLNLYDYATDPATKPTSGRLTAIRTWVEGGDYAQTSYAYDAYGNQTYLKTFSAYATANAKPTVDLYQTTVTEFETTYNTYPISQTNPLGQKISWTYDYGLGLPLSETDANGATITATYDTFGRMTSLVRPGDSAGSPTLKFEYFANLAGIPFTAILHQKVSGNAYYAVRRAYDGMGRLMSTETGQSAGTNESINVDNVVKTRYDTWNTTSQSAPFVPGATIRFFTETTTDALGRPLSVKAPDGTQTLYTYDGLKTTITDAKGHATTTVADVWGRTVSVKPPEGPMLGYLYDPAGRMVKTIRASEPEVNSCLLGGDCWSSKTVTLAYYAGTGLKKSMSDPDMGNWSYTYDALGSLKTQTDARGCILTLNYDLLNRLTGKSSSNSGSGSGCGTQVNVTNTYDQGANGKGRRTGMTDSGADSADSGQASAAWAYDARGRMTSETRVISGQSFTTSTTYNSADQPVSMTYPDGEVVTNSYNPQMLLNSVSGANPYVQSSTYDIAGRLTLRTLGNGLTQKYLYNEWNSPQGGGRLQSINTGVWNGSAFTSKIQNLSYNYDAVGNVFNISSNVDGIPFNADDETQFYYYDGLDRLTSWQLGSQTETYTYNSATGNLQTKAGVTLNYDDVNHTHAVSSTSTNNTYGYDANGNQTTRTVNGQPIITLAYNAENQLISASGTNLSASFTYDGDGKQVKSVVNGVTTLYVGAHYEVQGAQVTKYYFAGAQRVAMRRYTIPQSMTVEYLLGDHLGSTSLTTDANGNKISELRYKPWGEVRSTWTSALVTTPAYKLMDYTFTGQRSYMDDPTTPGTTEGFGLMFYGARWYDPQLGRFAQADSIVPGGVQGLDRYAYVNNSPVMFNDPTGHNYDCGIWSCAEDMYVPLSPKGQELSDFVKKKNESLNKIIQMGIAGELAGWGVNGKAAELYRQHLLNRYAWWVESHCDGYDNDNCKMNFFAEGYQSIYASIVKRFADKDGLPVEGSNFGALAFKKAGEILADFNSGVVPFDPANNLDERGEPFGTGILGAGYVKNKLRSLSGPARSLVGEGMTPTQGSGYNQFLYVDEVYNKKGTRVTGYSVVMSWCQEMWWKSGKKLC